MIWIKSIYNKNFRIPLAMKIAIDSSKISRKYAKELIHALELRPEINLLLSYQLTFFCKLLENFLMIIKVPLQETCIQYDLKILIQPI